MLVKLHGSGVRWPALIAPPLRSALWRCALSTPRLAPIRTPSPRRVGGTSCPAFPQHTAGIPAFFLATYDVGQRRSVQPSFFVALGRAGKTVMRTGAQRRFSEMRLRSRGFVGVLVLALPAGLLQVEVAGHNAGTAIVQLLIPPAHA